MTTPTLPYAPLTHAELNARVAHTVADLGWMAAAFVRDGEDVPADHLRDDVAALDDLQAAALARCQS